MSCRRVCTRVSSGGLYVDPKALVPRSKLTSFQLAPRAKGEQMARSCVIVDPFDRFRANRTIQFWMLILDRGSHILVSHGFHHRSKIAGVGEHPGSIVVPGAVQDECLRRLSLSASGPELVAQVRQMATLLCRRSKQPILFFSNGADSKQFVDPITHLNHSSSLRRLAVWYENDSVAPVEIFCTDTVQLSSVPHSRVSSKDDDVPKQIEHCRFPVAPFGSQQQFLLSIIVQ